MERDELEQQDATLILVRHGETEWNVQGRWQGQKDSRLTAAGQEQTKRIVERLSAAKISAVYSSDLHRAKQLADLIAASHRLPVIVREDLRERSYGLLEGKTDREAGASEGPWFLSWRADHLRRAPPAGETEQMVCERMTDALGEIADAHPAQAVLVATHGGPIKCALYHFLSIPISLWDLTWVANGSITVLRGRRDLMRVAGFNDVCHLGPISLRPGHMED
jgi:broad specificity phosphatase PhoE